MLAPTVILLNALGSSQDPITEDNNFLDFIFWAAVVLDLSVVALMVRGVVRWRGRKDRPS